MKRFIICSISFLFCSFLWGQSAPHAIKYQAVVRDLSGQVVANNENIRMRVSILKNTPNGSTVYSESHDCNSNGFGLIHFEIGRGNVLSGNFGSISWGSDPYFVKLEIDINNTGFSYMSSSELVSVPYALYAENCGGANFSQLSHNSLSKYSAISGRLENSALSESNGSLMINNKFILPNDIGTTGQVLTVVDPTNKLVLWRTPSGGGGGGSIDLSHLKDHYFPMYNLTTGQLDNGILRQNLSQDTAFVIGNFSVGKDLIAPHLRTKKASIDSLSVAKHAQVQSLNVSEKSTLDSAVIKRLVVNQSTALQATSIDGNLSFNGSLSGTHNIMTNALSQGQVWIGGANGIAAPQTISGDATINALGTLTITNPEKLGARYLIHTNTAGDSIVMDSNNVRVSQIHFPSYWKLHADGGTLMPLSADKKILLGENIPSPKAALHIHRGDFVLVSNNNDDPIPYEFKANNAEGGILWWGKKKAFRAGLSSDIGTEYQHSLRDNNIGDNSIALGENVVAKSTRSYGFGKDLLIDAIQGGMDEFAFAIGTTSSVRNGKAFAVGVSNTTDAYNTAIFGGENTIHTRSDESMILGYKNIMSSNRPSSTILGVSNNLASSSNAGPALAIGNNNTVTEDYSIALGFDNLVGDHYSISIGHKVPTTVQSINIGSFNNNNATEEAILLGNNNSIISDGIKRIVIGSNNAMSAVNGDGNNIVIGFNSSANGQNSISIGENAHNNWANCVVIANVVETEYPQTVIDPVFAIGHPDASVYNPFYIDKQGNTYLGYSQSSGYIDNDYGNLYANNIEAVGEIKAQNIVTTSDRKLKRNIRPLSYDFSSYLSSLQAYTYTFLADASERKHWGFIAQEVQSLFPELVVEGKQGLALNYIEFIPILWQINKEQQERIEEQQGRIEELERQVQYILEKIEKE